MCHDDALYKFTFYLLTYRFGTRCRVLAEFQSRKAQRILLRDRDMLKYLLMLVIVVVGYMVTWTIVRFDHVTAPGQSHFVETRHVIDSNLALTYCALGWWHYVIEVGAFNNYASLCLQCVCVCGTVYSFCWKGIIRLVKYSHTSDSKRFFSGRTSKDPA